MARDMARALDALNEEIKEVADWFEAQGLRVRAHVPLPSGGAVAWGKAGSAWEILSVGPDGQESALTSASIARRLEAAAYVADLLEEARRAQALKVVDVEAAVTALRALRTGAAPALPSVPELGARP